MSADKSSATTSPATWSLCYHLILFGLALLAPILVLCALLAPAYVEREQARIKVQAETLAHDVAGDLGLELRAIAAMLEALAQSPVLAAVELSSFHDHASRLAGKHNHNIILRDPAGQQILNTGVPVGSPLPTSALPDELRREMQAGQPYVSNIYVGAVRRTQTFFVSSPILTGHFAGHSLNASVDPNLLSRIIANHASPTQWIVTIHDREGTLAASSVAGDFVLGNGLAAVARTLRVGESGFVHISREQLADQFVGYARSQSNGWLVAVRLPAAEWDAIARSTWTTIAFFAAGLLSVSLILAFWFASGMARPMQLLAEQAASLDDAEPGKVSASKVREIEMVAQRMRETRERLAQSTRELRRSEESYRRLAATTPAGIFHTDPSGLCNYINRRCCEAVGGDEATVLDSHWLDIVHPDDRGRMARDWENVKLSDAPFEFECRVSRIGGGQRWVLGAIVGERDADQALTGYAGTILDQTDRKEADLARDESENRLRLALEFGRMGTGSWDLVTGTVYLDPIAASLYGLPPTAHGYPISAILALTHPEHLEVVKRQLEQLTSSHSPIDLVGRILRTDGETRWLAVRAQQLREAPTRGGRVLGVFFDITEQMRNVDNLTQLNALLERRVADRTSDLETANQRLQAEVARQEATQAALLQAQKLEALGLVAGTVTHDFNNALMIIQNGIRTVLKSVPSAVSRQELQRALGASEHAERLTRRLLSFARRERLQPETVDVAGVIMRVEDQLRHFFAPNIEFDVDVPLDAWRVHADHDELRAAMVNLVVNAQDAMPSGGKLTISVRNAPAGASGLPATLGPGDFVAISVTDTGTGMTPEVLARAAEPLFTTKPPDRGTGLGLASVKAFVDGSNGALEFRSSPGVGTTVEIFLPGIGDVAAHEADAAAMLAGAEAGVLSVLCVDDSREAVEIVGTMLRRLGHDVVAATDPSEAQLAAHNMPRLDLLVTDIEMPGMNGVALARTLQETRPDLAVIFVTGQIRGDLPPNTLCKPVTCEDIATKVVQVVKRAKIGLN